MGVRRKPRPGRAVIKLSPADRAVVRRVGQLTTVGGVRQAASGLSSLVPDADGRAAFSLRVQPPVTADGHRWLALWNLLRYRDPLWHWMSYAPETRRVAVPRWQPVPVNVWPDGRLYFGFYRSGNRLSAAVTVTDMTVGPVYRFQPDVQSFWRAAPGGGVAMPVRSQAYFFVRLAAFFLDLTRRTAGLHMTVSGPRQFAGSWVLPLETLPPLDVNEGV